MEDFKQYKIGAFEIEVIEKCKPDMLTPREDFYISQYQREGYEMYNRRFPGMRYEESKPCFSVGWRPIDNAKARSSFSPVVFDSYAEANRCAGALAMTDPENYYFVVEPDN